MSQELAKIDELRRTVFEQRDLISRLRDRIDALEDRELARLTLSNNPHNPIGEPIDGRPFGW